MSYREAIIEALEGLFAGMSFNDLLGYLNRNVYPNVDEATLKKGVSKTLKELEAERLIVKVFMPIPKGEILRLYTLNKYLDLKYALTKPELDQLFIRKYKRIEAKLNAE